MRLIDQLFPPVDKTFYVDEIPVTIKMENDSLRLITPSQSLLFRNQTFKETEFIIELNYSIVKAHYQAKVIGVISDADLHNIALKIVLYYFYMYNSWRTMYKKEAKRDLTFLQKDFDHPYTADHVVAYLKKEYPHHYREKCEILLDLNSKKFAEFEMQREQYFNK